MNADLRIILLAGAEIIATAAGGITMIHGLIYQAETSFLAAIAFVLFAQHAHNCRREDEEDELGDET